MIIHSSVLPTLINKTQIESSEKKHVIRTGRTEREIWMIQNAMRCNKRYDLCNIQVDKTSLCIIIIKKSVFNQWWLKWIKKQNKQTTLKVVYINETYSQASNNKSVLMFTGGVGWRRAITTNVSSQSWRATQITWSQITWPLLTQPSLPANALFLFQSSPLRHTGSGSLSLSSQAKSKTWVWLCVNFQHLHCK